MRVLLVVSNLGNGGAERQMTLLATHMDPSWECEVVAFDGGPFEESLVLARVRTVLLKRGSRFSLAPLLGLFREIRRVRPDVVHTMGWMPTLSALPFCRMLGIPIVDGSVRHGRVMRYRGRITALAARLADRAIANSQAGLDSHNIGDARGRVVYNGFDTNRLRGLPDRRPEDGVTEVVMAARMSHEKDYESFVRAGAILCDEDPGAWRFVLVGSGGDRQRVESLVGRLLPDHATVLAGATTEVLPLVRHADVGVLMSRAHHGEGCSNSLLEYMAAGLPVVCSDSGGNAEIVEEGVTGFIVGVGDYSALADRLRVLAADPQLRARMGLQASRATIERFSIASLVEGTISVYNEVLSLRRGAR